jgi:hypothetical protein
METFKVGDRVIFRPSQGEALDATVTDVFGTAEAFGGSYGINLDEPWAVIGGETETAAHGMELTKNA